VTASPQSVRLARVAARAASAKLARDPVAFDVSQRLALADVFLIVSAGNERQVGAVADGIQEALLAGGFKPRGSEGVGEGRWVLLDYLDVVVHVQHDEERATYGLEQLWKDCPVIDLPADAPAATG